MRLVFSGTALCGGLRLCQYLLEGWHSRTQPIRCLAQPMLQGVLITEKYLGIVSFHHSHYLELTTRKKMLYFEECAEVVSLGNQKFAKMFPKKKMQCFFSLF